MADDVATFQADLATWSKILDRNVRDALRYVALDLMNKIVSRNPVDTGYSRSQWRMAVDSADTTVDEQEKGQTYSRAQPDPAVLAGLTPHTVIFITNSVNYIQYLEEGSSKQSPAGMIKVSIAEVASNIDADIARARAGGFEG